VRSGIALASANRREVAGEDGVLTALEASGLDLYGTKLVVLSACETGVGEASAGEGVYGLRRALVIAGAEAQVMSLWKVDDGATRVLMTTYYEKLEAGGGRSEAMREAQRALLGRKEMAHPYYWAAFIVSGQGAALDGRPVTPDFSAPAPPPAPAKVPPSARGCACAQAGAGAAADPGGLLAAGAALAAFAGRAAGAASARRRRRRAGAGIS
jgi:hypothetical protein